MSKLENTTTPSTSYVPTKMHLCWRHSIHVNSKSNDCAHPTLWPTLPGQVGAFPLGRRVVMDLFYLVFNNIPSPTLHLSMQEFQSLKTLYRHIHYSESENTCKLFLSKMGTTFCSITFISKAKQFMVGAIWWPVHHPTTWKQKRTPCLSHNQESKCQTVTHRKLTGNNRVIRKVTVFTLSLGMLSPPMPSFSGILKVRKFD
jgi:hypothetical protein